jgi:hypothetical protein
MGKKVIPDKCKRLWKLKPSTKLCTDFYVLDVETGKRKRDGYVHWCLDARPQSFIFGVLYGYNYCKVIHSVDEFKSTLLEPRFKGKKIFAHNGGAYDYLVLYGNIYDYDSKAIFNGKFISFTNGVCTFADSMNVFVGASVKMLGKMLGLEKETLGDEDYKTPNKFPKKGINIPVSKEIVNSINYCIRDCCIVWDALLNAFEFAGEIKITQASLSMSYFRRFHQPYHIDHNENTKFFWESYYGGRCEAFKIGKTHAKVIDVNSMYPAQMKSIKFPNPKILKHELNLSVKKFNKYLNWFEGCASLTVNHADSDFGFLPYKKEGKLLFPTGVFTGTWNFNEIRFALEHNIISIVKVHYVIYSEPMESIFVSYVDVLNEMKTRAKIEGNLFEEDRAKRFSNSLYGKFAQRILEESIYIKDIEKDFDIIQRSQIDGTFRKLIPFNKKRNDAFLITSASKKMDVSYSIPSFASYITSGARIQLLSKMLELKNNKIVYCDTDSIFFEIDNGIKSEFHLGGWKVENKIITEIKGLKNYKYIDTEKNKKEIWKVKGVPVDKGLKTKIFFDDETEIEVPTVEQIGENKFRYFNLIKTKESMRRNKEPGVITERIKELKNKYDKRIVLKNGETKPIKLC